MDDKLLILEQWFIVLFALIFFGSIFNAGINYLFEPTNEFLFTILSYLGGFLFGLLAKYKKWGWIV
tara:strand:- start:620 stop:817 length:198 start_codon:yes stop_codon:yes gene_type:complete